MRPHTHRLAGRDVGGRDGDATATATRRVGRGARVGGRARMCVRVWEGEKGRSRARAAKKGRRVSVAAFSHTA